MTKAAEQKRGQIAIVLVLALAGLLFLVLMNADVFLSVVRKMRAQNGGDAAALAAARWQGSTLNLEGELNILHAVALAENDPDAGDDIVALQTRLAFAGPVAGLLAAQDAARQNHIFDDDGMTDLVRSHARDVRDWFGSVRRGDPDLPWPGMGYDYATMIEDAAADGIAAGPDNADFFDFAGGHLLQGAEFYEAVIGRNWCWFHFNAMDLLEGYRSWRDWGPLPSYEPVTPKNSEFFSTDVEAKDLALETVVDPECLAFCAEDLGYAFDSATRASLYATNETVKVEEPYARVHRWFFFGPSWRPWYEFDDETGYDGYGPFPSAGSVKPEFDLWGACAVCRVTARLTPVSPGNAPKDVVWSAAAKPFGYLESETGSRRKVTDAGGLVLPSFRAVRLIPLDTASGGDLGSADPNWVRHLRTHIPSYLKHGTEILPIYSDCPWCQALVTWENPLFRATGVAWLKLHSGTCRRTGPGPGGRGGRRHGH